MAQGVLLVGPHTRGSRLDRLHVRQSEWGRVGVAGRHVGCAAPLSALTGDTEIVRSIAEHSRAFGKPVLLINGDRHVFGVDSPLADPTIAFNQWYAITTPVPNLTRLTVQGSTSTPSSWVRLTINEADPGLFSVEEVPVVFSVVRRDSAWRDLASSRVPAGSRRRRTRHRAR